MQNIHVNGVNIRINGDADVRVDRFGNVTIDVKKEYIPYTFHPQPIWPKQIKPNNFWNKPKKHWLE